MTEVERWLKKYGKATTTTKKTTTATTKTTSTAQKVRSKEELNAIIKESLSKIRVETPEERLKRHMDKVPSDYHPGIHTKNLTLPIYRSQQYIETEINCITSCGGKILDIKTEPTTMFGFQTMYILIIYEMPGWEVVTKHF